MGVDLGTYWLRVEFVDGRGYIEKWETSRRYTNGVAHWKPIDAKSIAATWESENDLLSTMVYQYTLGNYSCDCNKLSFLARAYQQEEPDDLPCGDEIHLQRLTAIRPDASEEVIWCREQEGGE